MSIKAAELVEDAALTAHFHQIMQMACLNCRDRELYFLLCEHSDVLIGQIDKDGFIDNTAFFKDVQRPFRNLTLNDTDKETLRKWKGWKNDRVYRRG